MWDSFYAQTVRGCDRYVSTNYLADGLRVFHVLRLLWLSSKAGRTTWGGGAFDDYDTLIDLNVAMAVAGAAPGGDGQTQLPAPDQFQALQTITSEIVAIDQVSSQILSLQRAGSVRLDQTPAGPQTYLDEPSLQMVGADPALAGIELRTTPVSSALQQLQVERQRKSVQRDRIMSGLANPVAANDYQAVVSQVLIPQAIPTPAPPSLSALATPAGVFRVPLSVGAMKPPVVGDLILVQQELRRYELGEVEEIQSIMQGERRERTIRNLARTSQTTSTETSSTQEQTSSLTTDERFQLSSQAQKVSSESVGVQTGVNVSGKFGPVQVGASVNASFDTSKTSSASTSQDYAKTVTEEASKRVENSIKQTSSITVLTETQDTLLRGFNNEKGTANVNGLYRWVDKIYTAKLLNYGRRLMFSLTVPQPAAFFSGLLTQGETELMADVVAPTPPSQVAPWSGLPYGSTTYTGNGIQSYQDITEQNYAKFAALYDVTDIAPPPAESITGSKAIAYPSAMEAAAVKDHTDEDNELSYVVADESLTIDPNYRITSIGVYVPKDKLGLLGSYADALKLGTHKTVNRILVEIADKYFYFNAIGNGNDPRDIHTNFNMPQLVHVGEELAGVLQPTLPITITADFEGILTLIVVYTAVRRPEALDAWKAQTYAAIIKGYNAKQQEYEQALAVAQAKVQSATEAQTFQLREDQYRSIEQTELKRGCIDLMSEGTAIGYTSIAVDSDGTPRIVYDETEGNLLGNWRSPLANGAVAEFFEQAFEWEEMTYQFYPYYWTAKERWKDLAQASGSDPIFEQFLRAGSAGVVVPVRPGFERPVMLFLKTSLIWGGGYLTLFTSEDMLNVYADVELGEQLDPPEQIGDSWEIRLPTSLVMLQEGDVLPDFPEDDAPPEAEAPVTEIVPDATVPF